ncbi:MAG: hypothetical protein K2J83_02540, partial [Clostridia bacterium]|nr:hypothetical protein [Clostridia bacterium]
LEGNEIADDYSRQAATRGRWGETWDVFKSNFGKLVLINIIILITFAPGIAIMVFRAMYVANLGAIYPFNANTGLGYPYYPDVQGLAENIHLTADLLFYSLLVVAGFIASIGLSGGAYTIKKLLNTHGKFSIKSFFHGVKVCYFNTVLPITIFMVFLVGTMLLGDWKDYVIAIGESRHGPLTAYSFAIIGTVLVGIYCAWVFVVGVSYRVKIAQVFKNAFVLLIGSPLQTVFFAAFAMLPVWLFIIGSAVDIVKIISYIVFIFLGFSFMLLVWLSFTQWVLDLYVTPNIKAAQEEAQAKLSPKELAAQKQEEDKHTAMELLAAGKSELIGKPIKPISDDTALTAISGSFTRESIGKVSSEREKLKSDVLAYEKEHMSDPVYAEYNKLFAEREKALKSEGKKGKKKKLSADNLLKK